MSTTTDVGSPTCCPLCGGGAVAAVPCVGRRVLLQCRQCGLTFAQELSVSPDLYEDAYQAGGEYNYYHADSVEAVVQAVIPWPMRRFLRRQSASGHLLDVGCSTGKFMLAAKRAGWAVSGVEISASAVSTARAVTGAQVWAGTVDQVEPSLLFDSITAWEVLEHLQDPVFFVNAIRRRLKPGGILGLSVPNWQSPWMRKSAAPEHWPPFHLTYWTPPTLHRLLATAGFQDIYIQEKPFAWGEEIGKLKWLYLPVSLFRGYILEQKGMHLFASARNYG